MGVQLHGCQIYIYIYMCVCIYIYMYVGTHMRLRWMMPHVHRWTISGRYCGPQHKCVFLFLNPTMWSLLDIFFHCLLFTPWFSQPFLIMDGVGNLALVVPLFLFLLISSLRRDVCVCVCAPPCTCPHPHTYATCSISLHYFHPHSDMPSVSVYWSSIRFNSLLFS